MEQTTTIKEYDDGYTVNWKDGDDWKDSVVKTKAELKALLLVVFT
jgi:hypothetical protein